MQLTVPTIAIALMAAGFGTTPAVAQTAPSTPLHVTLTSDVLRDLPSAGSVYAILETTRPEAVADRFNGGGLNAGGPARVGAFLASWSRTQYRVGGFNVSSPVDGTPLLFPETAWWADVGASTGLMSAGATASGLVVALDPVRAAAHWTGAIEASAAGGALVTGAPPSRPAPIARLDEWASISALVRGPALNGRLGTVVGGSWSRGSAFSREAVREKREVRSAFAHLTAALSAGRELRTLVWAQSVQRPLDLADLIAQPEPTTDVRAVHVQSTFERRYAAGRSWRIAGAYTRRSTDSDSQPQAILPMDRLADGPVGALIAEGDGAEYRWSIGGAIAPFWQRGLHALEAGAELEGLAAAVAPRFSGTVAEHVDSVPARLWVYADPGVESRRKATLVSAFVHDRILWRPGIAIDASIRVQSAHGRARGAARGIGWISWLPSARLHWDLGTPLDLAFVVGGGRAADPPLLDALAYGDPGAPSARVFRWDGETTAPLTLVARAGPGTGGDPSLSAIDPEVRQPATDEFVIELESQPHPALRLGVAGLARRQSSPIAIVNIGVPTSGYTTFTIPDANVDLVGPADDQQLTVYNRRPETFGMDRYLLTNGEDGATLGAVVVSARLATDRLDMWIGGTASAASGSGGNRGFRAVENDHEMLGELLVSPNAATYARGRLFSDRAYTIKWTTVYRLPWQVRLGAIARYQDGQPFSRMVVVPGVNQGAEAIQAFANGGSRFAFTGTVDVRVQKGFTAGGLRVDAILDAYNLLNMMKEVEEYVVTGPRFRETTAIQPPRALHLGARMSF